MTYTAKRPGETLAKQERQQHGAGHISYLEREQLVADIERHVARAQLSTRAAAALWALRIFVIVVGGMVIYTFFSQLGG
jgi:hypothetical protein